MRICFQALQAEANASASSSTVHSKKTKAEMAFIKRKAQNDEDRIKKRANMNHKEKVEKFNSYLNTLSEHYDIPKVSWTK